MASGNNQSVHSRDKKRMLDALIDAYTPSTKSEIYRVKYEQPANRRLQSVDRAQPLRKVKHKFEVASVLDATGIFSRVTIG
jgi:hypothetical protein